MRMSISILYGTKGLPKWKAFHFLNVLKDWLSYKTKYDLRANASE